MSSWIIVFCPACKTIDRVNLQPMMEELRRSAGLGHHYGSFLCPRCGAEARPSAAPSRERVLVDLVTGLRDAGLSAEQLSAVAATIAAATPSTSPREIVESLPPSMTPVVTAAAKFGAAQWLTVLGIVVSGALGLMALDAARDAERARHSDAEKALRSAQEAAHAKGTADLTDEDIAELSERVNAHLKAERAKKEAHAKAADEEVHHRDK